jgi:prolyl 4-hydroxylase
MVEYGADLGTLQEYDEDDDRDYVLERIRESRRYVQMEGLDELGPDLVSLCKNTHPKCTQWAVDGHCESNSYYMKRSCAPACQSCLYLDYQKRCPLPHNDTAAWRPGDLNRLFEMLTREPYASRYDVRTLSRDPWVIQLENVISSEEAQRMIELGHVMGYQRSTGVGKLHLDGTHAKTMSDGRTSTNAWCKDECAEDTVSKAIMERLSSLTGIPVNNSESLQLLRYERGQYYRRHHDYISTQVNRQQGVRILTFYLYLNDDLAGGGTRFTKLNNLTVTPKTGRAVLWPSVRDDAPHEKDDRTEHEAMPVEAGVKYGANAWFHQFDFHTPMLTGCTE